MVVVWSVVREGGMGRRGMEVDSLLETVVVGGGLVMAGRRESVEVMVGKEGPGAGTVYW